MPKKKSKKDDKKKWLKCDDCGMTKIRCGVNRRSVYR